MNYTPEYYQARQAAQDYRQPAVAPAPPPKKVTPADGEEHWYVDGGVSNRMSLSLLSGIPKEINWALSRLAGLSEEHNARFVLSTMPRLIDAIFYAPEVYLSNYSTRSEPSVPFMTPSSRDMERKHATECVLVLRNAAQNDANIALLCQDSRTLKTINAVLRLPPDEHNTEMMIYAFEWLLTLAPHLPSPSKSSHPFGDIPLSSIEKIVSTSLDRSLIVQALAALTLYMTPVYPPSAPQSEPNFSPPYTPSSDSPALQRVIQFLAVVQDQTLLSSSLDFLAAYLTSLPATQAFLQHPKLTSTLKLLVGILRYEQKVEVQTIKLGPAVRMAEKQEQWQPYELSEEELARIAPMPEPERSFQWMNKMFENAPGAEQTQVTFWTLYKDTFTPFTQYPMLQAADIIRNVTIEFPEATASVVGTPGGSNRFVISNIRRRMKPQSPLRFRCLWNGGVRCTDNALDSPDTLYNHLLESHLYDGATEGVLVDPSNPNSPKMVCKWGSCPHAVPSLDVLRKHVLTHIPSSAPAPKNPSQPHAITLPYAESPATSSYNAITAPISDAGAVTRPVAPPPSSVLKFRGPPDASREPPSSVTLLALYSLRMLFWASFSSISSAAPVHDADHFGFPTLPSIEQSFEKEKEEREKTKGNDGKENDDESVREGARKGRRAFRSVCESLSEVCVSDEAIAWWVVDMIHRAREGADLE